MRSTKLKPVWLISLGTAAIAITLTAAWWFSGNSGDGDYDHINKDKIAINDHLSINVFRSERPEKGLLLYVGDKNRSSEQNAKQFANLSYYVAHIDPQQLLDAAPHSEQCISVADQLQSIVQSLDKSYAINAQNLPILIGSNDGAALVYAALAQSEQHNFHAGISINFTPRIHSKTPPCGLNYSSNMDASHKDIFPSKHLHSSWYVFQNGNTAKDKISTTFIEQINNAKLTASASNKPDAIDSVLQILQWLDPRLTDQVSSDNSNTDLPLIEVPAAEDDATTPMVVLLTGDGGWAEIDKAIARILAEKNIPTIALDSLSYFWKARTPEETAQDIDRVISMYTSKWNKNQVILVGYSFGADVLPFIANKLSEDNRARLGLVALLGMGKTASFEFRLSSWMNADKSPDRLPLLPEVRDMQWANSVCIYGLEDQSSACNQTAELGVKVISMSGDHHYDEKYTELVEHILSNAKAVAPPATVESASSEAASSATAETATSVAEEVVQPAQ
ncbi:MAG TPA: AcvB/VirJ family lysyl-phosphatidylglycerol hydrolase [Cellvibrio sp.]|nr:AcvB/VirJ family lysyl-phosphatidylglycerol hydrolase [Cellvibrio sp.]